MDDSDDNDSDFEDVESSEEEKSNGKLNQKGMVVESGVSKRNKYKIDDTNRDKRIDSINRIAKELRPLGKVVHVISSPNMQKELLATLISVNKEKLSYAELKAI